MNCHNEATEDDHHHHHGHGHGHDHDHDHDHDNEEEFLKESLLHHIDLDRVNCFNELETGSAKKVFKPFFKRLDTTDKLNSDCDPELLLFIPFTGLVKLKSIIIFGGGQGSSPSQMKAFINKDDIDFDYVSSATPVQEWELVDGISHEVEYQTRITKFNNVRNLSLYFPDNFGAESTEIIYIGLKGEFTELKDDPIITVYELQPNVKDHKVPGIDSMNYQIN
ncbi:UPF0424 family protein [Conidiobolus coronatus NRRL 28638]|uniref:UPF0424 family protein n=1 Tax=Conidiobolus coronatus (strain ATCC 28846 / CBS 209.66 / NRRL 28638) TaxID=796925 RepID=A0A137PBL2_CONC2|nr:UPF0424 family protein [Conidiobolus coronatus NRRL 28638]|eukprot:KXN72385.1 UPF0424 family protein [Conidiobolus coronatus NRRL 28638]